MAAVAQRHADRVSTVTGAGRNIGRDIAERLAREGTWVAVVDIDEDLGRTTVEAILAAVGPDDARFDQADLTDELAVAEMVATVHEEWGRIDGLVNNVAYAANKDLLNVTENEWDTVFSVSLKRSSSVSSTPRR